MMLPKRLIVGLISLCLMIRCTGGNDRCGASTRGACPPAWSQWGDKCYKKGSGKLPWAEAKQECIKMKSVLVMPQSQEETAFLLMNLINWFWIDCNDLQVEGSWVCTNDIAMYADWGDGEPNDHGAEDCAIVVIQGYWNDSPCDLLAPFICMRSAPKLHL